MWLESIGHWGIGVGRECRHNLLSVLLQPWWAHTKAPEKNEVMGTALDRVNGAALAAILKDGRMVSWFYSSASLVQKEAA